MKRQIRGIAIILGLLGCFSAMAEMRIWEDKKGNTLEAEFQAIVSGKVALKDRNGKVYRLSMDSLSEKDRKYLQTKIPPKVEIEFKKISDTKNTDHYEHMVTMHGKVMITKKSRMPYERTMKATMFIIGEDAYEEEYILMDKTEVRFDFKKAQSYSFEGQKFKMRQLSGYSKYGIEYKGYLVVVFDGDDNILEIKTSRKEFEENYDYLSKLKSGARFPDDMRGKATSGSNSRKYM